MPKPHFFIYIIEPLWRLYQSGSCLTRSGGGEEDRDEGGGEEGRGKGRVYTEEQPKLSEVSDTLSSSFSSYIHEEQSQYFLLISKPFSDRTSGRQQQRRAPSRTNQTEFNQTKDRESKFFILVPSSWKKNYKTFQGIFLLSIFAE